MSNPTQYTCTITYDAPLSTPTCSISPNGSFKDVHPKDTITFNFVPGSGATSNSKVSMAVLIAGCKEASTDEKASPFTGNQNEIDVIQNPTLTVGSRTGTWGFVVSFSTVEPSGMTNFYFLPDPEVVVTPGG